MIYNIKEFLDIRGVQKLIVNLRGIFVEKDKTTTWSTPTITGSAIAISSGGYYTEGRRCYVQMRCTLTNALNANTARSIASGLPAPKTTPEAALSCLVYNRGGHAARITSAGALQIISDVDHDISAGQIINITGVYTTA